MLKWINKMNSLHWLLVMIAVFTLFSFGKVLAVLGIAIAGIMVLFNFWDKIKNAFGLLFKGGN